MAITFTTSKPGESAPAALLDPGKYRFKIVDAEQTTSKAGNEMIEIAARQIDEEGNEGRKVWDYLVFTEKALWKVNSFLEACGKHPGEDEDYTMDPDDMIGWEFEAEVSAGEDSKGRPRNNIESYIASDVDEPF